MKDFTARFTVPLDVARPRAGRLLEALSPKLGRRLQLFDHRAFAQWVYLEADPSVRAFCERPARLGPRPDARVIDFWVQSEAGHQAMLLLSSDQEPEDPATVADVPIRHVRPADQAAAAMWVSNWMRMLPVIVASHPWLTKSLQRLILRHIEQPTPLARVEHELSVDDPSLVRGAIFELLRIGRLRAPSLHQTPLTLHILLEPSP